MFSTSHPDALVKIIDFGFVQQLGGDAMAHKQLGTFDTMAPEVFGGSYNTQADVSFVNVARAYVVQDLMHYISHVIILLCTALVSWGGGL